MNVNIPKKLFIYVEMTHKRLENIYITSNIEGRGDCLNIPLDSTWIHNLSSNKKIGIRIISRIGENDTLLLSQIIIMKFTYYQGSYYQGSYYKGSYYQGSYYQVSNHQFINVSSHKCINVSYQQSYEHVESTLGSYSWWLSM
jgi:hypothetical protein